MIISASRRTDIPAFYSDWFMNRIREGYLYVQNPFNANQIRRVDLSLPNVDVIVFWTKNPKPMIRYLDELDERRFRYYFQFTLTAYPKVLEPDVPSATELLSAFKDLSQKIGREKVIWRFDPITLSDVTPEQRIIDDFGTIAEELKGATTRVIISFVDLYKSVKRNFDKLWQEKGLHFHDADRTITQVRNIAAALIEMAGHNSMEIMSCAEKLDLSPVSIGPGKCIDDRLIKKLFDITVSSKKDPSQRKECQCVESQDIGQYNTCTHGCIYCYANSDKTQVLKNRALHDPTSPFLIGHGPDQAQSDKGQMDLFLINEEHT
jgi:hypothetical protein